MENLGNALVELRSEQRKMQNRVEELEAIIRSIEALSGANGTGSRTKGDRSRRLLSAAGRQRIAAAQRARWAKIPKESQPTARGKVTAMPVKRTISAAGRRKIAAAQRARWARIRKAA